MFLTSLKTYFAYDFATRMKLAGQIENFTQENKAFLITIFFFFSLENLILIIRFGKFYFSIIP